MDDARTILAYGALPALSGIGFYGSMYLARENGLIKSLVDIVRGKTTELPNTRATVIRKWTGIKPLDDYLAFYIAFFLPTLGKSHPTTTLQNRHFIGQFAALWTLIELQGQKSGNSTLVRSTTALLLTGFGIQTVGAATIVPLWCAAQLATSVLSKSGLAVAGGVLSESRTAAIPLATLLTILIPLGSASFIRSSPVKQFWVNVFQVFYLFTELIERTAGPAVTPLQAGGPLSPALARVYNFAEGLSAVSHLGIFTVAILVKIVPQMFPKGWDEHISFKKLFLPRLKLEKDGDLFEARVHFLRWDAAICLSSFLLWATYCYIAVLPAASLSLESLSKLGAEVLARVLITGPMGAAAHLLRQRDIIVAVA